MVGVLAQAKASGEDLVISDRRDRRIQKGWRDCYRELDLEGKIGTHGGGKGIPSRRNSIGKSRTRSLVMKAGRR